MLTAVIEYLTVLLEYIDFNLHEVQGLAPFKKEFQSPITTPICMPTSKTHTKENIITNLMTLYLITEYDALNIDSYSNIIIMVHLVRYNHDLIYYFLSVTL